MAWSLLTHVAAGSPDGFDITTASIDTSTADFLVASLSNAQPDTQPTISDSKSNTWHVLTQQTIAGDNVGALAYVIAPTVGAGHTFTLGSGNVGKTYNALAVAAFKGGNTSAPFDVQNGAQAGGATSLASGSLTPGFNNELIVSGWTVDPGSGPSVNAGFTITDSVNALGAAHLGVGLAYLIQGTLAAVNVTWSWSGSSNATAVIASFKVASAATVAKVIDGAAWRGAWRGVLRGA